MKKGIVVFLAFVFFSYTVEQGALKQFDFDAIVWLQKVISRHFDVPLSLFSLLGSFEVATLVFLLIWFRRRKLNKFYVLFCYGLLHGIELIGKQFIVHLGPPFLFYRYALDFIFPSTHVKPGFSYPSGHAARTAFLSAIILLFILRSKKLSPLAKRLSTLSLLGFDLVMFTSRVYLGEHWASDVIGGGLLGASLGLLAAL